MPGGIPVRCVLVHQQPHQFCNGDRGVRVVHLDGEVAMQLCQGPVLSHLNAHNVLQAAGDEEELLGQPKFLAFEPVVIRIKNLRDVLRRNFIGHGADEISVIKRPEVETLDSLRGPQPHGVHRVGSVAGNGCVVWNSAHHSFWNPLHFEPSLGIRVDLRVPTHLHLKSILGPFQRPRVSEPQPLVCRLHLPSVTNLLIENAVFIADAVANRGNLQCGQRIHEAGGKPAQPAIAQPRFLFLFDQNVQVDA